MVSLAARTTLGLSAAGRIYGGLMLQMLGLSVVSRGALGNLKPGFIPLTLRWPGRQQPPLISPASYVFSAFAMAQPLKCFVF
jgi:hypothetical protein